MASMRFLIALLCTSQIWAACSSIGTDRYHCASTGDPDADGRALFVFLNNPSFDCGSTIILDAGAEYYNYTDGPYYYGFRLKKRPGCAPGQYTQIVSSRLSELPEGKRVTWEDRLKMPKLVVRGTPNGGSANLLEMYGDGVSDWALRGIALTTSTDLASKFHSRVGVMVFDGHVINATTPLSILPKHILFDRVMMYPGEEEAYGPMENQTTIAPFFRSIYVGFNLRGQDIVLRDSYIKGLGGYSPAEPIVTTTITEATNDKPPVLTAKGIAAAFGLRSSSACADGCTLGCWDASGCRVGVFEGATNDWAPLNGWHYLVYDSPDTVKLSVGDSMVRGNPRWEDSTSWGSFSGEVKGRMGVPVDPAYAVLLSSCKGCKVVNNFLEAWSMTVFTGGGNWEVTDHTGTVAASGSDSSTIVLTAPPEGLAVGDLVGISTGVSSRNCPPRKGCQGARTQVCQVTAIHDATISCSAFGPQGMTNTPLPGSTARWNGHQVEDFELRRNWIQRLNSHTLAGKGYIELKNCVNCLIDGNIMTDSPGGNWFLTVRNQGGNDPWVRAENLVLSNNIMGGRYGGNSKQTLQGQDDNESSQLSRNVWVENNLIPEMNFGSSVAGLGPGVQLYGGGGIQRGGWVHNTLLPAADSRSHYALIPSDCFAHLKYLLFDSIELRDNLMGYGEGIRSGSECGWTDQAASIRGNVFVTTGKARRASIESVWPSNMAIPDISDELVGPCTFADYTNCALSPNSSLRGTATDGRDPGADVEQLRDRVNGWSEDAGLLEFQTNPPGAVPNHNSWQIGSVHASVRIRLFEGLDGCKVELFTDPNRTKPHADSDAGAEQSCDRGSSVTSDGSVQFLFGGGVSLTPSTTYYYRITDGKRVMVGQFTTREPGTGNRRRSVPNPTDRN